MTTPVCITVWGVQHEVHGRRRLPTLLNVAVYEVLIKCGSTHTITHEASFDDAYPTCFYCVTGQPLESRHRIFSRGEFPYGAP